MAIDPTESCRCSSANDSGYDKSLATFASVRGECPALKEILIPDSIWNEYQEFCAAEPDRAHHAPVTYLAYKQGYLSKITAPLHAFCLKENAIHPSFSKQYRKDLVERWMFKSDEIERYKKSRIFIGRMSELMFAQYLINEGWKIESLEALGGDFDICAESPKGDLVSIEVKHLCQDKFLFDLGMQALSANGVSCGRTSLYSPLDYLIFRVFEAAKQLNKSSALKIVVIIMDEYEMNFELQLGEGWIDWTNPKFFQKDGDIEQFLLQQYRNNPDLDQEIRGYISQVDQLVFCDFESPGTIRRREGVALSNRLQTSI